MSTIIELEAIIEAQAQRIAKLETHLTRFLSEVYAKQSTEHVEMYKAFKKKTTSKSRSTGRRVPKNLDDFNAVNVYRDKVESGEMTIYKLAKHTGLTHKAVSNYLAMAPEEGYNLPEKPSTEEPADDNRL